MDHLDIQSPITRQKGKRSIIFKVSTLLINCAIISGCNITMCGIHGNGEGIGYRQARFSEMNEMKAWRDCQELSLKLDKNARINGRFTIFGKCKLSNFVKLQSVTGGVNTQERMRSIAVASLNFLRGGILSKPPTFEDFKTYFKGKTCIFLTDPHILKLKMLLGMDEPTSIGALSMANVNPSLKPNFAGQNIGNVTN